MPKAERIAVKPGVLFIARHFRPEVSIILEVMLDLAPETTDGIVWVTEGWRPARHPRDLHFDGSAFDLRIHNIALPTFEARADAARAWAQRGRDHFKDRRYQYEIHGATPDQFHIHAEFDTA